MDASTANVKQAVPFFGIHSMEASLKFYIDGLGFTMTHQWLHEEKLRWCCLQLGEASIMLQEFWKEGHHAAATPLGKLGEGVTICFICQDALSIYHEVIARGIPATRPFVGNGMWVTTVVDPDGYRLDFESYTDVAEETVYSED